MPQIAEFVNGTQICEMFRAAGCLISAKRARAIKNELKKEHPEVKLPDKRVIPAQWVYEAYGDLAYTKQKDATPPSK